MTSNVVVHSAFVIVFSPNDYGKFLVGTETSPSKKGLISLPGGKFDRKKDEDLFDTVMRECFEETGLRLTRTGLRIRDYFELQRQLPLELHKVRIMTYQFADGERCDAPLPNPTYLDNNPLVDLHFTNNAGLRGSKLAEIMAYIGRL